MRTEKVRLGSMASSHRPVYQLTCPPLAVRKKLLSRGSCHAENLDECMSTSLMRNTHPNRIPIVL